MINEVFFWLPRTLTARSLLGPGLLCRCWWLRPFKLLRLLMLKVELPLINFLRLQLWDLLNPWRLHRDECHGRFVVDSTDERFKEPVSFFFILLKRVTLTVSAQTDAVFESIHGKEVVFPRAVDDLQKDKGLDLGHVGLTNQI